MPGQPIFLVLTSANPLELHSNDIPPVLLKRYKDEEWIRTSEKDGQTTIKSNGFVGCLPMGENKRLIIPPAGLSLPDSTSIYRLISFMIDTFSYYEDISTSFGSNRSSMYPLSEILPREKLISLFREELERLTEFPLPNFVRKEAVAWKMKGRVRATTLCKALFIKPRAGINCSYPSRSINSPENQLIKLTISELLKGRLRALDAKDKTFFSKAFARLTDVSYSPLGTFQYSYFKNVNSRYKQILALCNLILWKFSFSAARDVVTLGVPIVKPDYNVFENLVRAAFKRTFENALTIPYVVSSKSEITFNPDLILPDGSNATHLVLDMKFKKLPREQHGVDNKADVYQIISHSLAVKEATSLGLVYPKLDVVPERINILVLDKLTPKKAVTAIWLNQNELFEFVTSKAPSPGVGKMLETVVKELQRVQDQLLIQKAAA